MFLLLFLINLAYADMDKIGEVEAKGIIFQDTIDVVVFDDPTIKGVSCYTTRYNRSLSLTDSTNSSLSCRKTGEISGELVSKNNIFSQDKSLLFFKATRVDRFYDAKRKVLVYLSYTKSWGDKNSSHSLSVVPVNH